MSSTDYVVQSVPVDINGVPKDPTLKEAPRHAAGASPPSIADVAADASPTPAAEVDRLGGHLEDKFDPVKFAASLPKTDTANLASMSQMTGAASGVKTAAKSKPKAIYKGRGLKPVEFELDWPFELDGVDYFSVTIQSPTGDRFEQFQEVLISHGADVAVYWLVMGDTPPDVVEAIHGADKMELNEVIFPFLPRLMQRNMQARRDELREMIGNSSTTAESGPE